ncbi:NADH:flavin oxidoreductase [Neosynechococcus sphagnicola sy1]|uniref:NADH:flavin oxidoreductase n=1 Tax=Neosynechococcus sphagnicola sy1 TaxID=1497020 RepID=A0A098TKG5_9CYAN|nr:alkene reductase [Neosynechococcus sphagnicola]KGF72342.1 NADH:flavin oxidoreductase [Neosynechococcus sphagnicola sy1]
MNTQIAPSSLLNPFDLGDITLSNRVVMAPMTRARAGATRMPNALMAQYYAQRASAGLIITEATVISTQANGWQNTPGIYTEAQGEAWTQIVEAVHAQSTPIFLQLWHCGRASHSSFQENSQLPVAPSAIKINGDQIHTPIGSQPYETPRALETSEIPLIVEAYRQAAARAKLAGFDGVEIHGANGYLIDTFLQSKTNQRLDQYGGGVENRYCFLKQVVEAILTVWPANRVGVRLSPNGVYNDMGSPDYRETFLYTAEQLNIYGLAYLHLLDGLGFGFHELGTPMTLTEFRQVFKGPLIGNCGYTKEQAEAAIFSGAADLMAFGRPFISNPDLVERFTHNWPLNPPAEMKDWYSFGSEGYIDFPVYQSGAGLPDKSS